MLKIKMLRTNYIVESSYLNSYTLDLSNNQSKLKLNQTFGTPTKNKNKTSYPYEFILLITPECNQKGLICSFFFTCLVNLIQIATGQLCLSSVYCRNRKHPSQLAENMVCLFPRGVIKRSHVQYHVIKHLPGVCWFKLEC